jgi:signal transduction histidine kinase
MPQGGRLAVQTFQSESHVELTVEDTGLGMDKETQDKIFIPFYTTKPAGMGTGLGLPVAHDIVTDHRGEIHVASSPKSGTRIHVRLPKAPL